MCGIFAIASEKYISKNFIEEILLELKIRGKHSTGLSWVEGDNLKIDVQPVPANEYVIPKLNTKIIIGHTRYSTSSLEYNQPISNQEISVVHNGVITQLNHKLWDNKDYNFLTKNDSEYIIKSFLTNKHPLLDYPDASIASCVIDNKQKYLKFFRNDKRPLWYFFNEDNIIAISTKDVFKRLGIFNPYKCESNLEYEVSFQKVNIMKKQITQSVRDLQ